MMKHLWRSWGKSTFVVLLVVAMSNVANARQDNLYEAMKVQNVPSTIHAEDLTADWHIIRVGVLTQFSSNYYSSQTTSLFFTQGSVMSFGGKEYLVAYHVQPSSNRQERLAQEDALKNLENSADEYSSKQNSVLLYNESTLAVSLFQTDVGYQIHEIKQLNPQKDIGDYPAGTQETRLLSQLNLKQIALAMSMYTQDYDNRFPPMIAARRAGEIRDPAPNAIPRLQPSGITISNNDPVQNRLAPYAESPQIFLQPVTKRPYLPNYKISRHFVEDVKDKTSTFLFYEEAPDADGMRNIAYVDGHVKAISEAEFQRQRKAQGISESGYPSAAKPTKKAKPKT